jgi:hypothetical protein
MKKSRVAISDDKAIFLKALSEHGTVMRSCSVAGISRRTYERWMENDPVFSRDVDKHRIIYAEYLENIALERVRNPEKGIGTDALLYNLLSANNPNKFRPAGTGMEDSAKDLLAEWRRAQKEMRKERSVEEGVEELPASMEKELVEIMEKRGNAPEESEELEE